MELRNSIVLGIIALCAFGTVIFGFARIDTGEASAIGFAEERQKLVEQAQLWFIRSEGAGGGGMSFDSLNFHRLGYGAGQESQRLDGTKARYSITERKPNYFLLRSESMVGSPISTDTIYFDTML